jgi:hypothetical protein
VALIAGFRSDPSGVTGGTAGLTATGVAVVAVVGAAASAGFLPKKRIATAGAPGVPVTFLAASRCAFASLTCRSNWAGLRSGNGNVLFKRGCSAALATIVPMPICTAIAMTAPFLKEVSKQDFIDFFFMTKTLEKGTGSPVDNAKLCNQQRSVIQRIHLLDFSYIA